MRANFFGGDLSLLLLLLLLSAAVVVAIGAKAGVATAAAGLLTLKQQRLTIKL